MAFSLQGIVELLKRPVEPIGDGRKGYSSESLREIEAALAQQVDALDARIAGVRRELKEAQAVRAELSDDLDYIRRRIAGKSRKRSFRNGWPRGSGAKPRAARTQTNDRRAARAKLVRVAPPRRRLPWAVALATGLDYFDNAVFSFFTSYIAGGINASADELVWASSAYAVASVLGILQQQWWIERLGYRRYVGGCLLLFAAGAVAAPRRNRRWNWRSRVDFRATSSAR